MCRQPLLAAASRRTSAYSSPSTRSSGGRDLAASSSTSARRAARVSPSRDDPGVRLAGAREGLPLPEHRQVRTWLDHEDINDVMRATSLVPEGLLVLPPVH